MIEKIKTIISRIAARSNLSQKKVQLKYAVFCSCQYFLETNEVLVYYFCTRILEKMTAVILLLFFFRQQYLNNRKSYNNSNRLQNVFRYPLFRQSHNNITCIMNNIFFQNNHHSNPTEWKAIRNKNLLIE